MAGGLEGCQTEAQRLREGFSLRGEVWLANTIDGEAGACSRGLSHETLTQPEFLFGPTCLNGT